MGLLVVLPLICWGESTNPPGEEEERLSWNPSGSWFILCVSKACSVGPQVKPSHSISAGALMVASGSLDVRVRLWEGEEEERRMERPGEEMKKSEKAKASGSGSVEGKVGLSRLGRGGSRGAGGGRRRLEGGGSGESRDVWT